MERPNKILEAKCDVLILAAKERVLHKYNSPRVKCKVVAEVANGPTTYWGESICEEKGIQVIPDIILNSGSVTVGYFEWLKNIQHVEKGLLTRRWEELSKKNLYEAITGNTLTSASFGDVINQHHMRGPTEVDIVHSALEEIINT